MREQHKWTGARGGVLEGERSEVRSAREDER